ncbi:uncharacterized protein [Triticum aestivum]|uniref:uncharacterized protein n=1 Tax=Triticum aestivum TaxID=4565 RepID=UPI001D026BB0|nr:uncharacterized protein LOC123084757 [Triticum aestivum]
MHVRNPGPHSQRLHLTLHYLAKKRGQGRSGIWGGVRWLQAPGGGMSSSSTTRACSSPPSSIGWPWSWVHLNMRGGTPLGLRVSFPQEVVISYLRRSLNHHLTCLGFVPHSSETQLRRSVLTSPGIEMQPHQSFGFL